jgi:hypothetical protein
MGQGMGQGMKGAGMAGMQRPGMPPVELPETNGKKPPGNRFRLHTENTGEVLAALVDFSRVHSLKMNILSVNPPSLEDAFVMLTGEANHEK